MSEFHHVSVLLWECIEGLNIKPDGIYVDGTLGGAGHSSEIVKRLENGRHIGIDRDPIALKAAGERLSPYADKVTLVHSNFCEIKQVLDDLDIEGVDGILLDLGVSSPQLDDGERGFSYMVDAPLDMRMNREDTLTAHDVVNGWSYEELKNCQGVGEGKAKKFGKEFIELIAKYVEENEITRPDDFVMKSIVNKSVNKVFIIQSVDRPFYFILFHILGDELDEFLSEFARLSFSYSLTVLEFVICDRVHDGHIF